MRINDNVENGNVKRDCNNKCSRNSDNMEGKPTAVVVVVVVVAVAVAVAVVAVVAVVAFPQATKTVTATPPTTKTTYTKKNYSTSTSFPPWSPLLTLALPAVNPD